MTGSMLPGFLSAPARAGLLPRIHVQRPFFLKQHLWEGTDCPGYFSCSASPIQVCRASTILRA